MSKKWKCIDNCLNRAYCEVSSPKVMEQLNKEGFLRSLCKQKCRTIENSRTFEKCERRKRKTCEYPSSEERRTEAEKSCREDFRVLFVKNIFY